MEGAIPMTASPVAFRTTARSLYAPSFEDVSRLFERGDLVPVYRTLAADLETPVSVYLKLAHTGEASFLLESVEGGENVARFSFLGVNPAAILTAHDGEVREQRGDQISVTPLQPGQDALHVIKSAVGRYNPVPLPNLPRFIGGAVGFLAYDMVRSFEKLPDTAIDDLHLPEAAFMLVDTLVMFDHVKHQLIVLSNAHNQGDPRAAYDAAVERIEAIVARLKLPMPVVPTSLNSAEPAGGNVLTSHVTQPAFESRVRRGK